ncbi:hypothetical protein AB205_0025830 [Aquarana catesbeiana]|uniref:Uncharacterized protein n=1 Tax=Aquarana catesbeiana TaxID=8400 RepID=A0A2G9QI46_AQUCT|nr:hypothetical protein AB205_0025830 [Aquarana catesbeiana]
MGVPLAISGFGRTESCWEDSTQNNVLDKDASSQQADQASVSEQAGKVSVSEQAGQELMESQMSTPAHSTSATPVGDEEFTPPICPCVPARVNIHATRRRAHEPNFNRMLDIMASMSERMNTNRSHGFCKVSGRSDGEVTFRNSSRYVGRYHPIHSHI